MWCEDDECLCSEGGEFFSFGGVRSHQLCGVGYQRMRTIHPSAKYESLALPCSSCLVGRIIGVERQMQEKLHLTFDVVQVSLGEFL